MLHHRIVTRAILRRSYRPFSFLDFFSPRYYAFSSMPNGASTPPTDNPLEKIQDAIDSLNNFRARLVRLSELVDKEHTVPVTFQKVRLGDIVLHSRDANKEAFLHPIANAARKTVLETAQQVETELRELSGLYTSQVSTQIHQATVLCQETPCGGVTWELDMESLTKDPSATPTRGGNQKVDLAGMDTPCGRLQMASMGFLQTTYETKPQIVMGSRAHLILKLAMDFNLPLREIKSSGTKEQNQKIRTTFQADVVPTPWLRSDEEYAQLLQIQQELEKEA